MKNKACLNQRNIQYDARSLCPKSNIYIYQSADVRCRNLRTRLMFRSDERSRTQRTEARQRDDCVKSLYFSQIWSLLIFRRLSIYLIYADIRINTPQIVDRLTSCLHLIRIECKCLLYNVHSSMVWIIAYTNKYSLPFMEGLFILCLTSVTEMRVTIYENRAENVKNSILLIDINMERRQQ
jgi:hypothetical protein